METHNPLSKSRGGTRHEPWNPVGKPMMAVKKRQVCTNSQFYPQKNQTIHKRCRLPGQPYTTGSSWKDNVTSKRIPFYTSAAGDGVSNTGLRYSMQARARLFFSTGISWSGTGQRQIRQRKRLLSYYFTWAVPSCVTLPKKRTFNRYRHRRLPVSSCTSPAPGCSPVFNRQRFIFATGQP